MAKNHFDSLNIQTESLRLVDHIIAYGTYPDMTKFGWQRDDWPLVYEAIAKSDIVIVATPIYGGERSSVCSKLFERLYGYIDECKLEAGPFHNKVGSVLAAGNEDGLKNTSMSVLFALQHLGFIVPPFADAGWIGEVGNRASYLDNNSGGSANKFTNKGIENLVNSSVRMAKLINS